MKFEEITTAKDLVIYCACHGRPTDTESVCRMQDIIGHTNADILENIAKSKNKDTFFHLLFAIWHYEDAARIYNLTVNKPYIEALHAAEENKELHTDIEQKERYIDLIEGELTDVRIEATKARKKADRAADMLKEKEAEIIALKAKLYDLMVKEG